MCIRDRTERAVKENQCLILHIRCMRSAAFSASTTVPVPRMWPQRLIRRCMRDVYKRQALFCGENFTFGAKAAGTPELLRTLCAPLGVEAVSYTHLDVYKRQEDISEFISAALSPAKVVKVELLPGETRSCRVIINRL